MVASIPNDIFQFSLSAAHARGFRTGGPPVANLTTHGSHGIGVFAPHLGKNRHYKNGNNIRNSNSNMNDNGKDEDEDEDEDEDAMILLDRKTYRISSGSSLVSAADAAAVMPFAMVTAFAPGFSATVEGLRMGMLEEVLGADSTAASGGANTYMPFRIEGRFRYVRVGRLGAPRTLDGVDGSGFGFLVPRWAEMVSGPRFQCCFVSAEVDGSRWGGVVMDFEALGEAEVAWAKTGRFHLGFPQSEEWEAVEIDGVGN